MALHYQTECRMGTRRINRSYSGYQAFVAILFDLVFGLFFEFVATFMSLTFRLLIFSARLVIQVLKSYVESGCGCDGGPGLYPDAPVRTLASRDRPARTGEPLLAARGFARSAQKPDGPSAARSERRGVSTPFSFPDETVSFRCSTA